MLDAPWMAQLIKFYSLFQGNCNTCGALITRNDGSPTYMKNHLNSFHPELYKEFLLKSATFTKEKVAKVRETQQLKEEVEDAETQLAEASGSQHVVRKRPIHTEIGTYFKKGAPVKYRPNSDFQRRADLEIAKFFVTGNLPFKFVDSKAFRE